MNYCAASPNKEFILSGTELNPFRLKYDDVYDVSGGFDEFETLRFPTRVWLIPRAGNSNWMDEKYREEMEIVSVFKGTLLKLMVVVDDGQIDGFRPETWPKPHHKTNKIIFTLAGLIKSIASIWGNTKCKLHFNTMGKLNRNIYQL